MPTCPRGGSATCICFDKCESILKFGNLLCVNNTPSVPTKDIVYPAKCNLKWESNIECNFDGTGTVCPMKCTNKNDLCLKDNENAICHPTMGLSCPFDCKYDNKTRSCLPQRESAVCEFINKTLTCPFGCSYYQELNKCISSDPNYSCELERKLLCPVDCKLNIRGDICIPNGNTRAICNRTKTPECPFDCKYDADNQICKSSYNRYNVCEPRINLMCPHNEFLNVAFRDCYSTSNDICWNGYALSYPKRLEQKYTGIMCKYSSYGNCEKGFIQHKCCN